MSVKPTVFHSLATENDQLEQLAEVLEAFDHSSPHINDLLFSRECFLFLCCGGLRCRIWTNVNIFQTCVLFLDEITEDALESDH